MLRMDESHQYWWGDTYVPGVNEILRATGLVNTDYFTEEGAARGKRRHLLVEDYDKGEADWDGLDPDDSHILIGYQEFLEETGFVVQANELPLYHPVFHYAGTLDKVGVLDDKTTVLDVKTGSSVGPWAKIQVALYALAYAHTFDSPIPRMGILHLRKAKKRQYSWKPISEPYIVESAISIVETYHWQQGNWGVIATMHAMRQDWIDDLERELDGSNKSQG